MSDSEDDPKLRMLLQKIAAVDVPDYPDWKRGRKWGLVSGIITALVLLFLVFVSGSWAHFWKRLVDYGPTALGVAATVFVFVGAVGAFRPRND